MIFRSSLACIGFLSLPIVKAFSDTQTPILILDSSPRKLFDPTCHLDEQSGNLYAASQQDNITHTVLPSHNPELAITSLPTWVNPPFCISQPKSTPNSPPYCVWTSRDFRSGRGISIIATQEVANTLASSLWFLNAHVQISDTVPTPGYKVTPLPGRGLGLVANSTYKRGDLIMSEIPLLLSSLSLEKSNLSEAEQARLYRNAVSRLPINSRKLVGGLHGHPDQSAARKFAANAFNIFDFAGLFPAVARMNHDCRPNAAFHFDKDTFTQRINAIRPIGKGEEITISCTFMLSQFQDFCALSWKQERKLTLRRSKPLPPFIRARPPHTLPLGLHLHVHALLVPCSALRFRRPSATDQEIRSLDISSVRQTKPRP
jgi:hypothetical protein